MFAHRFGIDPATNAYAAIPRKHLLAQVSGISAQLPLMHAVRRAEGAAPARHLDRAPAA
jgi:hypothetical protein